MNAKIRIRDAKPSDAGEIARIHVDSWKVAYRGIIADEALDSISTEGREETWMRELKGARDDHVHSIAEAQDRIVGFATGGPERGEEPEVSGEMYTLYLDPSHLRRRIGTRLFERVADAPAARGHESMLVWVLEANVPACRFYEKMGGQSELKKDGEIAGEVFRIVGYVWQDLQARKAQS